MSRRQPRRSRRRVAPAPSLPRPTGSETGVSSAPERNTETETEARGRAHHVTTDYRYVRTDLIGIVAVGAVAFGFVIAMAFLI
ncbi:MAG TPA: hypothetical protein QGF35_05895 [Dehalococcoidia bacterium]|nr:hypothetical protein [Dehalococcoidia bacterium]